MSPRLVALRLPPGPGFAGALRRVWSQGDAVAPLDPQASETATDTLLRTLRPSALIDHGGEQGLSGGAPVARGTALVVATSGYEKAVVLGHEALETSTAASLRRLGCEPSDRWLCCLPTHHVAGIAVLLRAWALGNEPLIHPRFDPAAVAAESEATHVSMVPTMLARLLDAGVDLARLTVLLGGAAAPCDLLERAREAGARVVTSYGMTETCGGCVYDGVPLEGYEVRVGDDGRVRIRGAVCEGYRLRDDLTAAAFDDGWLVTADRGRWRDDGRLEVLGRVDDVIVTGGENVDAKSVADVLRKHPAVSDAAALGRPDPQWGEALIAYCVQEGTVRPDDSELAARVRAALGRAAAPKEVRWVESIPRGPLGKVRRAALMRDDGGEQTQEER